MRIAVIGTGISGMLAARLLHERHEVTVFEASGRIGGHAHTVSVAGEEGDHAVDTGFIVYNERNYPHFTRLLDHLQVETQPSDMSFSVSARGGSLEYSASSLNGLFAQRRNLLRPSFWSMLRGILRFYREAPELLEEAGESEISLGEHLGRKRYPASFVRDHLLPMGAAIWSTSQERMLAFPARFFVRFLQNHGLLSLTGQPLWRTIRGGSRSYVRRLVEPYRDRIRLRCPVERIARAEDEVRLRPRGGPWESYDHVVLATHSDQSLALLADPSQEEREILGSIPFQPNDTVLHTDSSLLPRRPRARASWNYQVPEGPESGVTLTYSMNRLQSLRSREELCVTLNASSRISRDRVLRRMVYHHPLFTPEGTEAQRRRSEISGRRRTHYCGAYWGYGFHEDGVRSALAVAEGFGAEL